MRQIMFFREFRVRALCEMASGGMVLFIVRLGYIAKARGMLCVALPILVPDFMKDLAYQPCIKASVQIKAIPHNSWLTP